MYEPDIHDAVNGIHRVVYVDPVKKKKYFTGIYFKLYGDEIIIRSKEGSVLIWRQRYSDKMHCRYNSVISRIRGIRYPPGKSERCQILAHDCEHTPVKINFNCN